MDDVVALPNLSLANSFPVAITRGTMSGHSTAEETCLSCVDYKIREIRTLWI